MARKAEVGWVGRMRVPLEGPCRKQQQVGGGVVRMPENPERERRTGSRKRGNTESKRNTETREETQTYRRCYRKHW